MKIQDKYLAKVIDTISIHGHMVQGVMGDEENPPFCYTVGLTAQGLPELWICSLPIEQAGHILNSMADFLRATEVPPDGPFNTGYSVDFMLHGPVDLDEADVSMATYLYNEIAVLQVVWPDDNGLFPTDTNYEHTVFPQRLLPLLTKEN